MFATYPTPSAPAPRIGLGDEGPPGGGATIAALVGVLVGAPIVGGLIGYFAASPEHKVLGTSVGAGLALGTVLTVAKIQEKQSQAAIGAKLKSYHFSGPIPAGATTGDQIVSALEQGSTWKDVSVTTFDTSTFQAVGTWDDTSGSTPPAQWNAVPA